MTLEPVTTNNAIIFRIQTFDVLRGTERTEVTPKSIHKISIPETGCRPGH